MTTRAERLAGAVGDLLGGLRPYVPLLDEAESAAFLEDLDRLNAMLADHAGIPALMHLVAGMAARVEGAANRSFDLPAATQVRRIQAAARRLRDAWAGYEARRRR